ncbi:MAG: Hsp20 family protein [Fischerella sp.]|nr:Hsp20 family protein [Fischerella sp.]
MTKQYSLTVGDFPSLSRHFLGVERLFDQLNRATSMSNDTNYPPYNIIKHDEYNYTVELAVAGFSPEDIDVEVRDGNLVVSGQNKVEIEQQYLHRGISNRAFVRSFALAEDVVVKDAIFENGLLKIRAERIVPEEKKPRKIAITKS